MHRRVLFVTALIAIALLAATPTASVAAQAGQAEVDSSFGDAGRACLGPDMWNQATRAREENFVALADGRFLLAGGYDAEAFRLTRLLPNGQPDDAFGESGSVLIEVTREHFRHTDGPNALEVQRDGRILVSGLVTNPGGQRLVIVRLTDDGVLDPSFSKDGIRYVQMVSADDGDREASAWPEDIRQLADGRIMVAAGTFSVRLGPNGNALDRTFDEDGKTVVWPSTTRFLRDVDRTDIQPDGSLMFGGRVEESDGDALVRRGVFVLRLLPDGSPDTRLGAKGFTHTWWPDIQPHDPSTVGGYSAFMFQEDGGLVVLGRTRPQDVPSASWTGVTQFALRYTPEGILDANFSGDGKLRFRKPVEASRPLPLGEAGEDGDGRMLVAVAEANEPGYGFYLRRIAQDGTLDAGFGADGLLLIPEGERDWMTFDQRLVSMQSEAVGDEIVDCLAMYVLHT